MLATVFSAWKRSWDDAATAYTQAYVHAPWHHDLAPNQNSMRPWGKILYPFRTDRYGFRAGTCASGEGDKSKPAIFVVGDLFTEGLGVPYEESFAGLMACEAAREGKAVWNLGVMAFSPVIYHRKIRAAAEKLGIGPTRIYVFLDLSDITDDAIVYRVGKDGTIRAAPSHRWFDTGQFLLGNFATFRLSTISGSTCRSAQRRPMKAGARAGASIPRSWTRGRRGLELAGKNMDKIVEICREWKCQLTLVVYPWPDNVRAGDRTASRSPTGGSGRPSVAYASSMALPPFFQEPPDVAVGKYFIPGDVHFSAQGHRLLFEELKRSVGLF